MLCSLIAATLFLFQSAETVSEPATITVNGEGRAEEPASNFSFIVDIAGTDTDRVAALAEASRRLESVRANLSNMDGLERLILDFTELEVDPSYSNCGGSRSSCPIVGWRVSAQLSITGWPATEGPNAVSLAAESGATETSYLEYGVEDIQALSRRARLIAVEDARGQATAIAEALGMEIGGVQQVSYGSSHLNHVQHESSGDDRIIVTGSRITASVRFQADQPMRFTDEDVTITFILVPAEE